MPVAAPAAMGYGYPVADFPPDTLPSRNRAFGFYQSPLGRRLLRSRRLLDSIERDLLEHGTRYGFRVFESELPSGFSITIRLSADPHRYRRVSFLSRGEYEFLCRNPSLEPLLRAGRYLM